MTKYNGYYIDGVIFNSKEDIDCFVKESIITKLRHLNEMFTSNRYTVAQKCEIATMMADREHILMDTYGMTPDEIETAIFS